MLSLKRWRWSDAHAKLTEATIRSLATAQSFSRGEDYYHYLYEGMIDEAVQTIDRGSYWGYETLEWVVDAA